jgi:A/G-specific adenine glycosylase
MADYTQAQMDFGATLCTRHDPACDACPLQSRCLARLAGRVHELPTPRPGKPLPERSAVVMLLHDRDGRVLLQRRPGTGVWAALWSLPEAGELPDARAWFAANIAGEFEGAEPLPAVVHAFTHYRLHLHPLRWDEVAARTSVADNGDLRWVRTDELGSLGVPAPVRRLLAGSMKELVQ